MYLVFLVLCVSHLPFLLVAASTSNLNNITLPGCQSKCGILTVPYPFGIISADSSCSIGPWFNIICNTSFNPPKAFLPIELFSTTGIGVFHPVEVMDISSEHVRIKNTIASKFYNQSGVVIQNTTSGLVVANSYFTLSELNKLIVIGCDEFAIISPVSGIEGKNITSGCVSVCSSVEDVPVGSCSGMGCCSTSVPAGLNTYITTVSTLNNHKDIWHFDKWGYAFLGEQSAFTFRGASDFTDPDFPNRTTNTVPVVLDWVIGNALARAVMKGILIFLLVVMISMNVLILSTIRAMGLVLISLEVLHVHALMDMKEMGEVASHIFQNLWLSSCLLVRKFML
ncbi:wall-associated receptor kinase 2-like protein [Tanacetum coccineum]